MAYIMYMYVCEQARWARSAGNSAIENVCIIIIYYLTDTPLFVLGIVFLFYRERVGAEREY